MGFGMVFNYYFQSTLMRSACTLTSVLRGLVFPVSLVLLLPLFLGYDYIWLAIPIGEIITALIALLIFLPALKKLNSHEHAEKNLTLDGCIIENVDSLTETDNPPASENTSLSEDTACTDN
jgi:hypothetical protein